MKCPNCKTEIRDSLPYCPVCWTTLSPVTTVRLRVHLDGDQNVFSVSVYGYPDEKYDNICEASHYFREYYGEDLEIVVYGYIAILKIVFEEHQTYREYSIDLSNSLGSKCGYEFDCHQLVFDNPTYAGGYEYMHPVFTFKKVAYSKINDNVKSIELRYL